MKQITDKKEIFIVAFQRWKLEPSSKMGEACWCICIEANFLSSPRSRGDGSGNKGSKEMKWLMLNVMGWRVANKKGEKKVRSIWIMQRLTLYILIGVPMRFRRARASTHPFIFNGSGTMVLSTPATTRHSRLFRHTYSSLPVCHAHVYNQAERACWYGFDNRLQSGC